MLDKNFIKQIIDNGETLTIDSFDEPVFTEIMTKKYENKIYYIKLEDYEPIFLKKLN